MGQLTFILPPASSSSRAKRYQIEGFQSWQHCKGRGENPYENLRGEWWDQGWCEAALCDMPEPARTNLEKWLAGGNE